MGGFLQSIFAGSNPSLPGAINTAGNVAGFGTSTGMGDTRTASDFLHQIIGGDPAAISRLLAPQIGQMAGQANQKIQTEGEFGNRSGGMNAGNQATMDQTRGNIDNMISGLTGGAVGQLGQMGQNLLNTGLSANGQQAQLGQMQMQNAQNSLLGNILGGAAGNLGTGLSGMGSGLIGW
jgi:hypothetical protein